MKIRKRISTLIILVLFFLLQTTLFQHIKLAGVVPNLLLILTVAVGYMRGRTEGLIVGLICGLLFDMMYGSVIGLCAFAYMAIGFLTGYCQKVYYTDAFILPVALVFLSDFVYGIFYFVVEFLMRGRVHFLFYFIHVILPEMFYTAIISVILFRFLHWIEKLLSEERRKEA